MHKDSREEPGPVITDFENCDPFLFEISTPFIVSVPSFRTVGGRGAEVPQALVGRSGDRLEE
jgi:hypothetical protein